MLTRVEMHRPIIFIPDFCVLNAAYAGFPSLFVYCLNAVYEFFADAAMQGCVGKRFGRAAADTSIYKTLIKTRCIDKKNAMPCLSAWHIPIDHAATIYRGCKENACEKADLNPVRGRNSTFDT